MCFVSICAIGLALVSESDHTLLNQEEHAYAQAQGLAVQSTLSGCVLAAFLGFAASGEHSAGNQTDGRVFGEILGLILGMVVIVVVVVVWVLVLVVVLPSTRDFDARVQLGEALREVDEAR